jgi:hypothetical protein
LVGFLKTDEPEEAIFLLSAGFLNTAIKFDGEIHMRRSMVKAVVGDEAQIKAFEEALSSSSPQAQVS